jgi:hypothetical protein
MRIDGVQPLMDLADAMGILHVLGLRGQARTFGRRCKYGRKRRPLPFGRFLRDIADAHARWRLDGSVVGLIDAGDELQQARLAGAVAANQTDADLRR